MSEPADLQEWAAELQERYAASRRAWIADPENGLHPVTERDEEA